MRTNWLWDSRLSEREVKKILKDVAHPKFDIYAEKLFSRTNDPVIAFNVIDRITFCKKWPAIKKRLRKDAWIRPRVAFWQTIYERVLDKLNEDGINVRKPWEPDAPKDRMNIASQIKSLRVKLGYTQEEMAKKLGVIQQYVSKIESGRENITIDSLKHIAAVLGRRLVIKLS